jgi:hypothetical protein
MKLALLPETISGKLSVVSLVVFLVMTLLLRLLIVAGGRNDSSLFNTLVLIIPLFAAGLSGVAAFVTGLRSIVSHHEQSLSVYLATTIGLVVSLFVVGFVLFSA